MMPFEMLNRMLGSLDDLDAIRALIQRFFGIDFDDPFRDVKKVLCVQPHPDDCEVAIGGILAKLYLDGKDIAYSCSNFKFFDSRRDG